MQRFLPVGIVLIALCSVSCGNKNNSSSGGNNNGAGFLVSSGNYSQQSPSSMDDPTLFTSGCQTPGQSTSLLQIDSRLHVGQVFVLNVNAFFSGQSIAAKTEDTIASVSASSIVENIKILAISGVPGINPGDSATNTCTLSSGNFSCVESPAFPSPSSAITNNCTISNETAETITVDKGTFTLANGTLYNASRLSFSATGIFTCGTQTINNGTISVVEISSNDFPSEDQASYCGGVSMFVGGYLKNSDGSTSFAVSVERTDIRN
jgi:hypothetical protein